MLKCPTLPKKFICLKPGGKKYIFFSLSATVFPIYENYRTGLEFLYNSPFLIKLSLDSFHLYYYLPLIPLMCLSVLFCVIKFGATKVAIYMIMPIIGLANALQDSDG